MLLDEDKNQVEPSVDSQSAHMFYTVKEAASLLKVSEDTVRRMLRRRQLKFVAISERTRRIPLEAFKELGQKGA